MVEGPCMHRAIYNSNSSATEWNAPYLQASQNPPMMLSNSVRRGDEGLTSEREEWGLWNKNRLQRRKRRYAQVQRSTTPISERISRRIRSSTIFCSPAQTSIWRTNGGIWVSVLVDKVQGKNHGLQKTKANKDVPSATTASNPQHPGSASPVTVDASTDAIMDDASKNILDGRSTPRYNAMIF